MARILVSFFGCSVVALALGTAACSSGEIAVGKTDQTEQELKTKKDGTPTGNGQTCSWNETVAYDVAAGSTTPVSSMRDAQYSLGEDFKSLDGCNECACTKRGIMCTVRSCGGGSSPPGNPNPGPGCTMEAKLCPDGSYVERSGPNCEFAPCPGANDPRGCTEEARQCPDGSVVVRTGPNCEFTPCPVNGGGACAADAKQCPDGSYVSRTGPSCEFAACP